VNLEAFEKIAVMDGGWTTLFHDPATGRYLERTYPHSEMHGGGTPEIKLLTQEEAQAKYQLDQPHNECKE
jgi:hypothetical protein